MPRSEIFISDQSSSRRPQRGARERILRRGCDLMAERGLEAVNTNSIARSAGVGVGTFYRHFEDKHALLRACMAEGLEQLQADLLAAQSATVGEDVAIQVRAGLSAFVAFAAEDPARFRIIFSLGPSAGARARSGRGLSHRPVERALYGMQENGEVAPDLNAAVAARAFTAAQAQTVLWWLQDPKAPEEAELIDTLVRLHPAIACRL